MTHQVTEGNPFMMLTNPEVVLAAIAKSERLGKLNRQLCRPLDRPAPASADRSADIGGEEPDDAEDL